MIATELDCACYWYRKIYIIHKGSTQELYQELTNLIFILLYSLIN